MTNKEKNFEQEWESKDAYDDGTDEIYDLRSAQQLREKLADFKTVDWISTLVFMCDLVDMINFFHVCSHAYHKCYDRVFNVRWQILGTIFSIANMQPLS